MIEQLVKVIDAMPESRKKIVWNLIFVLVCILLLFGAFCVAMRLHSWIAPQHRPQNRPVSLVSAPVAPTKPQAAPAPAATQAQTQPKPAPAPAAPPIQAQPAPATIQQAPVGTVARVEAFFNGDKVTVEGAAELSRKLAKATVAERDAVFRLWRYAGERGERSVLMDYAAALDPSKPQWGSVEKNALTAWAIYEQAKMSELGAAGAQAKLKTWLEREAAEGNAQARVWLKQLPAR